MIFKKEKPSRSVFPLTDDASIGQLEYNANDETFDDVLSQRSPADMDTKSYVGNFTIRRARRIGLILLFGIFSIFLFQVGNLQIINGESYRAIADNNRTRTKVVIPNRGVITDRNGRVLAWNTPTFHLVASRADIPSDQLLRSKWFSMLGENFHTDISDFETRYQDAKNDSSVLLADDVPYIDALSYIAEHQNDPSLTIELASTRSYISNQISTLSHVLGFTGSIAPEDFISLKNKGYRRFDSIGKQGIEAQYEEMLRGTPGIEVIEVNAEGKAVRTLQKTDTIHGTDLTLSIDAEFTQAIEGILREHLETATVKRAAVVVSNPQNGEILALLSYPAFDANLFAQGITQEEYSLLLNNPDAPLFPRATQGEYPSGSTIKPVYAAAALMEGIITPSTSFLSTGGIWLGTRFFPDWRAGGHGFTNVYHAIADSVNTFFYVIGGGNESFDGLGIERLMQYAGLFGFGSQSGIDIPNEAAGFLPSKEWKFEAKDEPWYIGDTYNVSIGQGDFLVTPLQMNRSTAVFANGGTLITPHLVKDTEKVTTKIIPDDVATVIRDAMRQTVTIGSATMMNTLQYPVAGKTGTAQWAVGRAPHTWFTGFGPFDDPQIAVTVVVEEGANAYYSTPIARDIFEWWFAHLPEEE